MFWRRHSFNNFSIHKSKNRISSLDVFSKIDRGPHCQNMLFFECVNIFVLNIDFYTNLAVNDLYHSLSVLTPFFILRSAYITVQSSNFQLKSLLRKALNTKNVLISIVAKKIMWFVLCYTETLHIVTVFNKNYAM